MKYFTNDNKIYTIFKVLFFISSIQVVLLPLPYGIFKSKIRQFLNRDKVVFYSKTYSKIHTRIYLKVCESNLMRDSTKDSLINFICNAEKIKPINDI